MVNEVLKNKINLQTKFNVQPINILVMFVNVKNKMKKNYTNTQCYKQVKTCNSRAINV